MKWGGVGWGEDGDEKERVTKLNNSNLIIPNP